MEKLLKKVLICDDNEDNIKELIDSFKQYNKDQKGDFSFEVEPAKTIDEVSEKLKGHPEWDIVIIDRKFPETDPSGSQLWEKHILKPLFDLQSNAIKIVFTAHPLATQQYPNQDLIEAMQLGAWDYIDKNYTRKRGGNSFDDVVDSAIKGLNEKRKIEERKLLSAEARYWIREHGEELFDNYPGLFVAIKKISGDKWDILKDCVSKSLFGLYGNLYKKNIDKETVYIFWVEERRK